MTRLCESLESRRHFAVSLDANGWTVVTPATDTKIYYVSSSSGVDTNTGLTPQLAVKTLARAQALVRNGFADQILLKRGDTFEPFGEWKKKGRSAQEPLLIAAYGAGARPLINSGVVEGIYSYGNSGYTNDNLIISSLSFFPNTYDHTNGGAFGAPRQTVGIRLLCPSVNITIEDCRVAGYNQNIVLDGPTDSTVRRNVVLDAHAASTVGNGYSQGIYLAGNCKRITIEENVFDHNGWRTNTPSDRIFFNHNVYTALNATGTILRNNISAEAGFYGFKLNGGGTVTGNVFFRNSSSVYMESATTVENNLITESVDMPSNSWGVAILTQSSPTATIRGNLITNSQSAGAGGVAGIELFNNGTSFAGTIENNVIYKWRNAVLNNAPANSPNAGIVLRNNQVTTVFGDTGAIEQRSTAVQAKFVYQSNIYSSGTKTSVNKTPTAGTATYRTLAEWKTITGETDARYESLRYYDPTRSLARYNSEVLGGAATTDALAASLRNQDKTNWDTRLSAPAIQQWFRIGYNGRADLNADNAINSTDFNVLVSKFGRSTIIPTEGDLNFDRKIDTVDFNIFISQFGRALPPLSGALPLSAPSSSPSSSPTSAAPAASLWSPERTSPFASDDAPIPSISDDVLI